MEFFSDEISLSMEALRKKVDQEKEKVSLWRLVWVFGESPFSIAGGVSRSDDDETRVDGWGFKLSVVFFRWIGMRSLVNL